MDNSLVVQLGMDLHKMEEGIEHGNHLIEGFKEQVEELGKGFLAAFAIEKIAEFAFEVSELAAKAHGVKQAFSELPQSIGLLEQMRETTHETVGDLELMGFAIHAQNLNIPLKDLGELLEFTHIRALATNQDFNTLADTLITAIGRGGMGAKRAMAQLQISTEDYTKALKENGNVTEAVMSLAREAIEKNKGKMDETLQSIEANNAAWENFKIKLGETLNASHVLAAGLGTLNASLKVLASDNLSFWEKVEAFTGPMQMMVALQNDNYDTQRKIAIQNHDLVKTFDEMYKKTLPQLEAIKNIAFYEHEIKDLREEELTLTGPELTAKQREIELEQKKLDLLKNQYKLSQEKPSNPEANQARIKEIDPSVRLKEYLAKANEVIVKNRTMAESFEAMRKSIQNLSGDKALKTIEDSFKSLTYNMTAEERKQIDALEQYREKIAHISEEFGQTINEGIKRSIATVAEGLGEMAVGAETQNELLVGLLNVIAGVLQQLGELAIGAGITAIALENLLENPYTAIAAGIALVALAGAVRGSAKNIMHGGSGGGGHAMASAHSSDYSRGGSNSSPVMVNGAIQIKGQDLWVILSNYKTNSKFTKIGG